MSVFIFRRDLRLVDNLGLNAAFEHGPVTCLFVFDDLQISEDNPYRSVKGVQFLLECLLSLQEALRAQGSDLVTLYCSEEELIDLLIRLKLPVYANADYTPFARYRDSKLAQALGDRYLGDHEDYTLTSLKAVANKSGEYYKVFKYYYQAVRRIQKAAVHTEPGSFATSFSPLFDPYRTDLADFYARFPNNPYIIRRGGREHGEEALKELSGMANYATSRDYPAYRTTVLSPYIKFGVLSINEVFRAILDLFGDGHELLRQVVWHDFYAYIMYHAPIEQTIGGGNMRNKQLTWDVDNHLVQAWQEGRTGFPLMDAGMRQLIRVGWMHNRVRMLCANMFTLIFRLDWHIGERFFAQHLIDYDVSSNNGNWQWNSGVGLDHSGYLRIFNPFTQSKEYDSEAVYIQTWIPELRDIPAKDIHAWDMKHSNYPDVYYPPIVDFATRRKEAMIWFGK